VELFRLLSFRLETSGKSDALAISRANSKVLIAQAKFDSAAHNDADRDHFNSDECLNLSHGLDM
jgi:hypothetical protein